MEVLLLPNCENVKKDSAIHGAAAKCWRHLQSINCYALCFIVIALDALHSQDGETELYTVRQAESEPHRTFGGMIFNLKKGECSGRTATEEGAPPVVNIRNWQLPVVAYARGISTAVPMNTVISHHSRPHQYASSCWAHSEWRSIEVLHDCLQIFLYCRGYLFRGFYLALGVT